MSRGDAIICLDLEGPLTIEDYGFRLLAQSTADGDRIFAVISRYDDALVERGRTGYEAGDTLALILPFLAANGLDFGDVAGLAGRYATTVAGAPEMIGMCQAADRRVHVISASYEPFALAVADLIGLAHHHVCCTRLNAEAWRLVGGPNGRAATIAVQEEIRARFAAVDLMGGAWDDAIVDLLDSYFFSRLPKAGCPYPGSVIQPLGGRRKARAVENVARRYDASLSSVIYVGDSITDVAAFRCVDAIGGLAVSFNGNRYALGAATVAVAADRVTAIVPLLDAWLAGGAEAVREMAHDPAAPAGADWAWLPDLTTAQRKATVARHAAIRRAVRNAAGALG